jgi:O-acetyl-ADP-ribose deacetylase (regulator of RNase III)
VVSELNRWIGEAETAGVPVIACRDGQPVAHCSYRQQGGPLPPHGIQDTPGARFHPDLELPPDAVKVSKGTAFDRDACGLGFESHLLAKATRAVDPAKTDTVLEEMRAAGRVSRALSEMTGRLLPGGSFAGAIHRAAGPGLAEECRLLAPIRHGQAVITGGQGLPNVWVIHCLGPGYGVDQPADRLLADCYHNALELVDGRHLRSLAFPVLSTGAFGYPAQEAAVCARTLVAILRWL